MRLVLFGLASLLLAFGLSPGTAALANDVTVLIDKSDIDFVTALDRAPIADYGDQAALRAGIERSSAGYSLVTAGGNVQTMIVATFDGNGRRRSPSHAHVISGVTG